MGGGPPPEDVLDLRPRARPRRRRALLLLLAVAVVAGLTALVIDRRDASTDRPSARPMTPSRTLPVQQRRPAAGPPLSSVGGSTVSSTSLSRRRLGLRGPWELYGLAGNVVVHLDLRRGRLTRTTLPAIQSSGAVSLVAVHRAVIVRPWDFVPGYVVPDGRPAGTLPGALARGGPALPGPDDRHVWLPTASDRRMTLVSIAGRRTSTSVAVPAGYSPLAVRPDENGYLLFDAGRRLIDATPSGTRGVASGSLLAAGRTGWLTVNCRPRGPCHAAVVDRSTSLRRVLPVAIRDADSIYGAISPDGRTTALIRRSGYVALLDCRTGRSRRLPVRVRTSSWPPWQTIAWAPRGATLFVADSRGHVVVLDPRTREMTDLTRGPHGVLPPLNALAVRQVR